jgi:hypothetical protein
MERLCIIQGMCGNIYGIKLLAKRQLNEFYAEMLLIFSITNHIIEISKTATNYENCRNDNMSERK